MARLLADGVPVFGLFVPSERPPGARSPDGTRLPPLYTAEGAQRLAEDPSLDFLFLNLESGYDPGAVETFSTALERVSGDAPALLVRIPPIEAAGEDVTAGRINEVLTLGADGVVMPHVRSAEEARRIVGFFEQAEANVWTPTNGSGDVVVLMMIEDAGALASAGRIADTPGFSVLAVGIGSMTRALGGDASAAEAAKLEVLRHANRVGLPDMTIATATDVTQRVTEGFSVFLLNGPEAAQGVLAGRAAVGR